MKHKEQLISFTNLCALCGFGSFGFWRGLSAAKYGRPIEGGVIRNSHRRGLWVEPIIATPDVRYGVRSSNYRKREIAALKSVCPQYSNVDILERAGVKFTIYEVRADKRAVNVALIKSSRSKCKIGVAAWLSVYSNCFSHNSSSSIRDVFCTKDKLPDCVFIFNLDESEQYTSETTGQFPCGVERDYRCLDFRIVVRVPPFRADKLGNQIHGLKREFSIWVGRDGVERSNTRRHMRRLGHVGDKLRTFLQQLGKVAFTGRFNLPPGDLRLSRSDQASPADSQEGYEPGPDQRAFVDQVKSLGEQPRRRKKINAYCSRKEGTKNDNGGRHCRREPDILAFQKTGKFGKQASAPVSGKTLQEYLTERNVAGEAEPRLPMRLVAA